MNSRISSYRTVLCKACYPPLEFLARLQTIYSPPHYEQILHSFGRQVAPGLRVNRLLTNVEAAVAGLTAQGLTLLPVPWREDSFYLDPAQRSQLVLAAHLLQHSLRVLPDATMRGFYIALLRKRA